MLDINKIFSQGREAKAKAHSSRDEAKLGNLRGGMAGMLVSEPDKDVVYGGCHRKALLRMKGLDVPPVEYEYEMFDEGYSNEDVLNSLLQSGYDGPIIFEDDYPIEWNLESGRLITGRADAIIGKVLSKKEKAEVEKAYKSVDAALKKAPIIAGIVKEKEHYIKSLIAKELGYFVAVHGLEYKKKLSWNGVRNAHFNHTPDTKHLIQSAHYSFKLGEKAGLPCPLPYSLIYRWGVKWNLDSELRIDTVEKASTTDLVETRVFGREDWRGRPGAVVPGRRIFNLTWKNDKLYYKTEGMKQARETNITMQAITDFYTAVDEMEKHKNLGPRPSSKHPGVGVRATFSDCGFCKLKTECYKYEENYDEWLDRMIAEIDKLKQKGI